MRTTERLEAARKGRRVASAKVFTGLLLALILLIAMYLIVKSDFFAVGSIVVNGNKYILQEDVYRIADIPEKVNIFKLSTVEIGKRLSNDLRVAEVEVKRQFPATIVINIKERQPIAYIANQYGFVQLDKQGVVLAVFKNIREVNVPVITGTVLGSAYIGDKIELPALKGALSFLDLLDENTINQLSEVNVKAPEQMVLYTTKSVQIRIGANERLQEKAKWLVEILNEINEKKMAVEYVDLSFNSPIIKFKQ